MGNREQCPWCRSAKKWVGSSLVGYECGTVVDIEFAGCKRSLECHEKATQQAIEKLESALSDIRR